MVEADIFTAGDNEQEALKNAAREAGDNTYTAMNFEESAQQYTDRTPTPDPNSKKYKIKSDLFVLGGSLIINAIPVVADVVAHKNDEVPHKIDKSAIARLGLSAATPTVKLIDDAFLGGKLQEKTHGMLDDIGNIINIVCAYPAVHTYITTMTENSIRGSQNKVQIPVPANVKFSAAMGLVNIVTPYVASRLAMPNLTLTQKFSMCLPIPIIGKLFSHICRTSGLGGVYETGNVLYRAANQLTHTLKPVVRNNPGSTGNKVMNGIDNALGLFGDLTGMTSRGIGYNGYGGYDNGYGRGSVYGGFSGNRWSGGSY